MTTPIPPDAGFETTEVTGPHDPVPTTPDRPRPSLRRTTTIDTTSPEGLDGPMVVDARGRDLRTAADGSVTVVVEATATARLDRPTRRVLELTTSPDVDGVDALLGASAGPGFRRRLHETLPGLLDEHDLMHLLLDDLTGASLVAGYARLHAGLVEGIDPDRLVVQADLCAGWAADGAMMGIIRRTGKAAHTVGPAAPDLERPDDPWAWHEFEPLAAHGMRRRRRLDVEPDPDGEGFVVEVHFRDSHVDDAGLERIVHEYLVTATVDAAGTTVLAASADPRTLPWVECPAAAASAERLAGARLGELRSLVRTDFRGTSTCTHLNDTLRGLDDVPTLITHLAGPDAGPTRAAG